MNLTSPVDVGGDDGGEDKSGKEGVSHFCTKTRSVKSVAEADQETREKDANDPTLNPLQVVRGKWWAGMGWAGLDLYNKAVQKHP